MPDAAHSKLPISFHGRIIDHFGIEMYQKPVAALAELITNAWDADAELVEVSVPATVVGPTTPTIIVKDSGNGMTFEECRTRFLNIGYNTRADDPTKRTARKNRPILGRKGIGKFAGFGVARIVRVETVSRETGEKTVFEMDVEELRGSGVEYVEEGLELDVIEYLPPDEERKSNHGTSIILKNLLLSQGINKDQFARSMARRFLLHQRAADFVVMVNGSPLPEGEDLENVEFMFPRDYREDEEPEGILYRKEDEEEKAWGIERLSNGECVEWRFLFYKDTIGEQELRGIAVFTNQKLAQEPFLFNLVGGLGGQQGVEYLHGRIEATYLDQQSEDIIAPERQRINWDHPAAQPLEEWGKERVKKLLTIWKSRRNEGKIDLLNARVGRLGQRLEKLRPHERKTVEQALRKLASVSRITTDQFIEIGNAVLLSWEQGKLRALVEELASTEEMDEGQLLSILLESQVVTALHTLEAVEARVEIIDGLAKRIEERELENPLRDYIAENPWLISPTWDLFTKEQEVPHFIEAAREGAKLADLDGFKKRVDLVLAGNGVLLIVEFMRPDKAADFDHLFRFHTYVSMARDHINATTAGPFHKVLGYLIADKLAKNTGVTNRVQALEKEDMFCMDWRTLLEHARRQWHHYFEVLIQRSPQDERIEAMRQRQEHVAVPESEEGQLPVVAETSKASISEQIDA